MLIYIWSALAQSYKSYSPTPKKWQVQNYIYTESATVKFDKFILYIEEYKNQIIFTKERIIVLTTKDIAQVPKAPKGL